MTAQTRTRPSLADLLAVDEEALARDLMERRGEYLLWPSSQGASVHTGRQLRWQVVSGRVLKDLPARLELIPASGGILIRAMPDPEPVSSEELTDEQRDALLSATPEQRDALVGELYSAGVPQLAIAEALGVSRQRVSRICRSRNAAPPEVSARPRERERPGNQSIRKSLAELYDRVGGKAVVDDLADRHRRLGRERTPEARKRADEFWKDVAALISDTGVSPYTLSRAMGLSIQAVRQALSRRELRS